MARNIFSLSMKILCGTVIVAVLLTAFAPAVMYGQPDTSFKSETSVSIQTPSSSPGYKINEVSRTLFLQNGTVINGNSQYSATLNISPVAAAYDPLNNYLYVTENSAVAVINATTLKFVKNITSVPGTFGILFDPQNGNIYTSQEGGNLISVINTTSNTLTAEISGFSDPYGITLDPVSGDIYVANYGANTDNVSILDPFSGTIIGSVSVGKNPKAMAYDSATDAILVVNVASNDLSIINASTNSVEGSVSVGSSPDGITYVPAGNQFYVTNDGSNNVTVINGTTYAVEKSINVGNSPYPAAYDPANGLVYVPNFSSSNVTVINGTNDSTAANINAGSGPYDAVYANGTGSVYVVNFYSQSISEIPTEYPPTDYNVTFSETGLPANHAWYVELSNGLLGSTVSSSFTFSLPNGTYSYGAYNNGTGSYHAPAGSFTVSGGNLNIAVNFTTTSYTATFIESGIPANSTWYLSILGTLNSVPVTGTQYSANLSAGNYSYSAYLSGYNDLSGYFVLLHSNATVYLNFTPVSQYYTVRMYEQGLPQGSEWSVRLNNGNLAYSNSTGMAFSLQNGTYKFTTTDSAGMYLISNDTFVVSGATLNLTLDFASPPSVFLQVFPLNSTLFLNSQRLNTSVSSLSLKPAPGTYYINASKPGYYTYSDLYSFLAGHEYHINITLRSMASFGYLNGTVTPANATITANGMPVPVQGNTFNDSLSPGSYYVSATASGYTPLFMEVNITSGKTTDLNLALNTTGNTTYSVSGHVAPANASVVFGEYSAYVNSTGYYRITLPGGTYTLSVVLYGYYPFVRNVSVQGSISNLNITLIAEPPATSHTSNANVTATGYNVTVSNLTSGNGNISLTYNASPNGTLSVVLPYSEVQNATIYDLLDSQVYINGQRYYNFTVAISTVNGTYSVILTVTNLSGDPTLSWVFSHYVKVPSPPNRLSPGLLIEILVIFGIAGSVAALTAVLVRKRRS